MEDEWAGSIQPYLKFRTLEENEISRISIRLIPGGTLHSETSISLREITMAGSPVMSRPDPFSFPISLRRST